MSMERRIAEDARLTMLKALAAEVSGSLGSDLLRATLESFGIARSRDWVHAELGYLADIGAVRMVDAGSVKVVSLTQRGLDHVERRIVLEGVRRPSIPAA